MTIETIQNNQRMKRRIWLKEGKNTEPKDAINKIITAVVYIADRGVKEYKIISAGKGRKAFNSS